MRGLRAAILAILLAAGVAVIQQALVRLVEGSGAAVEPARVLILLLAAFLGLLTAVATRSLNLPSAVAPTALILAWTIMPPIFAALPWEIFHALGGDAQLTVTEALALAVSALAATVTLSVQVPDRE